MPTRYRESPINADKIKKRVFEYWQPYYRYKYNYSSIESKIWLICGEDSDDATMAVLKVCDKIRHPLYFDFSNVDAAIAPVIFSKDLSVPETTHSWNEFFNCVAEHMHKKLGCVFFDKVDNRNDKEDFYKELEKFHNCCPQVFIGLIVRKRISLPFKTERVELSRMSNNMITKKLSKYNRSDALRVLALTDGRVQLVEAFDDEKSVAENLMDMLRPDSPFVYNNIKKLSGGFRSPESYNTLMYAIATGCTRLSEIAKAAGFQNNKCDKYLKALIEAGFVKIMLEPNNKGTLRSRYSLADTYLDFWYACIFPNWSRIRRGLLTEDFIADIMKHLDDVIVPKAFTNACKEHLAARFNINAKDEEYIKTNINGFEFDCVRHTVSGNKYIKIISGLNSRFTAEEFKSLREVFDDCSYYDEYYLFLNGRFSDSVWKEAGWNDKINLIQPEWLIR